VSVVIIDVHVVRGEIEVGREGLRRTTVTHDAKAKVRGSYSHAML